MYTIINGYFYKFEKCFREKFHTYYTGHCAKTEKYKNASVYPVKDIVL